MTRVRVATYNVHSGVGVDRRFRPERIAGVIDELGADIVALQEVLSPVGGFDVHGHLREASGLHLVTMATMQLAGGTFGNALLSRWPILDLVEHGLTVGNRYLVPKLTYDETRHEFAPGHLLVQEVLRDCVARGLSEFDFLGVAAPWKMEWAPAVRTFHHSYVFARGMTGRSAHTVRFRLLPAGRRLTSDLAGVRARIFA